MEENAEPDGIVRARGLTTLLRQGKVPTAAQVEAAAMEIFSRDPIPIAPANKLLCCALLCATDWLEEFLEEYPEIAGILGQITLRQEVEIFQRWSDGQLREGSAQALLRGIRGEEPAMDLATIFNGDGGDE
jgi:hypothetical protein